MNLPSSTVIIAIVAMAALLTAASPGLALLVVGTLVLFVGVQSFMRTLERRSKHR